MIVEALKPPDLDSNDDTREDPAEEHSPDDELSFSEASNDFSEEEVEQPSPAASKGDVPILNGNSPETKDDARPNKKRRRS